MDNKENNTTHDTVTDDQFFESLFNQLDKNADGKLDPDDLKYFLIQAGIEPTQEQINKLIEIADTDKDRFVSREELKAIFENADRTRNIKRFTEVWLAGGRVSLRPVAALSDRDVPTWKLLVAGGVAGAVSRTCTSPLERMKILFQINSIRSKTFGDKGVRYDMSITSTLRKMIVEEGFAGLFKGNGTNVLRIAPYSAVQFFSFEKYKSFLKVYHPYLWKERHLTAESLLAGGCAGVTALVSTYPLDLIRTRLTIQTTEGKYNGIVDTFKKVINEEGFLALYKGVGTSALGIAPYVAINFAVYDFLKRTFIRDRKIDVTESLAYGGISGAVAQTVTYPIDLLRRRMQLQGAGGSEKLYTGPLDAAKKIVKEDGWKGLYRGMIPCYLKVIPAIAISFGTYEVMRQVLGIEQQKTSFGAG